MARYDDDDRVVMIERDGGSGGFGAFLLGLAIGAGAALLLAPESGEEMRARIRREAKRAQTRAKELADDVSENISDVAGRTRSEVTRRVDQARGAVQERARQAGDALEAGKVAARQARSELDRAVSETKRAYADARRQREDGDESADGAPDSVAG